MPGCVMFFSFNAPLDFYVHVPCYCDLLISIMTSQHSDLDCCCALRKKVFNTVAKWSFLSQILFSALSFCLHSRMFLRAEQAIGVSTHLCFGCHVNCDIDSTSPSHDDGVHIEGYAAMRSIALYDVIPAAAVMETSLTRQRLLDSIDRAMTSAILLLKCSELVNNLARSNRY